MNNKFLKLMQKCGVAKFVEIQEEQKNKQPLQEEATGNNDHPLHQNENSEQQEENEEQKNCLS